jgi:hypothetical protein
MLSAEAIGELQAMRDEVARLRDFIANITGPNVRRTPWGITIGADDSMRLPGGVTDHNHWFKITSEYDDAGADMGYSWVRAACTAAGIKTVPDTANVGSYLYDINGNKGLMNGQYVRAVQASKSADDSPVYLIIPAIPHAFVPVNLSSPSAASSTGAITYTAKTIDDAYTLGSTLTPTSNNAAHRIVSGLWYAPCTGSAKAYIGNGEAYYKEDGTFVLHRAFETLTPFICGVS